jgi:hypothetical protein
MELNDLDNKFTKFNIKWFSLLYFMKIIARLQVGFWQRSYGYLYYFGPTNGSLQKQEYLISIKGQTNWVASQMVYLYGARLDSIVAKISDEEIKMAKMSN